jgi:hypothetical protein
LLCPLTTEEQVEAIEGALGMQGLVTRLTVAVPELRAMAPLSFSWNVTPVALEPG